VTNKFVLDKRSLDKLKDKELYDPQFSLTLIFRDNVVSQTQELKLPQLSGNYALTRRGGSRREGKIYAKKRDFSSLDSIEEKSRVAATELEEKISLQEYIENFLPCDINDSQQQEETHKPFENRININGVLEPTILSEIDIETDTSTTCSEETEPSSESIDNKQVQESNNNEQ